MRQQVRGRGLAAIAGWALPGSLAMALLITAGGCSSDHSGSPHATASPSAPAGTPDALIGSSWRAEDIGGAGVIDYAQTTLVFPADGRAEGSGGCNQYSGPVSVEGDAIIFGHIASTRKACVPALLDQEQKFFIALAGARTFTLAGSSLTLLDAAGRPVAQLSRM